MAIENKLLALAFGALSEMGFKVWIWKGWGLDRCCLNVFGIIAKFPWWKSDSISPYFHGRNPAALRLRCDVVHKTLFSLSFRRENTTMGIPHFHYENRQSFVFGALWHFSKVSCLCIRCVPTWIGTVKPW